MKYSQAILVACIGGAALVSAAPTADKQHPAPAPAPKRKSVRVGAAVGKLITHAGTFSQSATGAGPEVQRRTNSGNGGAPQVVAAVRRVGQVGVKPALQRRTNPGKGGAKHAAASIKRVGQVAVQSAGGGAAVATHMGSIVNLANTMGSGGVQRRGATAPATDASAPDHTTSTSSTTSDPAAAAEHPHKHGKGKKHLTPEEKKAKAEKWKKMSPAEKQALKEKKKHRKAAKHGGDSASSSAGASTPPTTSTTTPVAAREFEDDVFARAVEEELEARGFFSNLKANYNAHKAESQAMAAPPMARDFVDEDALALRDVEDLIYSRDLEDELEARGLFSNLKANYNARKAESQAMAAPPMARDFVDEDALALRDLEDLIYSRDFADDLEARGKLRNAWHALKDTVKGTSQAPAADPNALQQRDFEGELATRDIEELFYAREFDDLEVRGKLRNAWHALKDTVKGTSPAPAADPNALQQRDFDEELAMRDIEELFYARDFEDDLKARGMLSNAWHALKDTVRGKSQMAADPNAVMQRDFDDELAMRDIEELLYAREFDDLEVRGKLRNAWHALKDTVKGTSQAPAADPNAVQRRAFFDIEDLDARDFVELNELD